MFVMEEMYVVPMPGDGDCFYHAFIAGVGLAITPKDLRNFVADQILTKSELFEDIVDDWKSQGLLSPHESADIKEIATRIKNRKEWATTTVIHILSDAFNVRTIVYRELNGHYVPSLFPYLWTFDPKKRRFAKTLYLYSHGQHFDLLQPVQPSGNHGANLPSIDIVAQKGGTLTTTGTQTIKPLFVPEETDPTSLFIGVCLIFGLLFIF
jgi:hypothetical protein